MTRSIDFGAKIVGTWNEWLYFSQCIIATSEVFLQRTHYIGKTSQVQNHLSQFQRNPSLLCTRSDVHCNVDDFRLNTVWPIVNERDIRCRPHTRYFRSTKQRCRRQYSSSSSINKNHIFVKKIKSRRSGNYSTETHFSLCGRNSSCANFTHFSFTQMNKCSRKLNVFG